MVTRSNHSKGNRKKYLFGLTPKGHRVVRTMWRGCLFAQPPADIDSVLRIIDLAIYYGAPNAEVAGFASKAANARLMRSQQLAPGTSDLSEPVALLYPVLRSECDHATLRSEAEVLEAISARLGGVKASARRK